MLCRHTCRGASWPFPADIVAKNRIFLYNRYINQVLRGWNPYEIRKPVSCPGDSGTFRRNGLFPGKDFYVIGFDNLEPSMPDVEPFLTTCDHRWDEIGRLAADTILQLVAGKNIAEKDLTVEPEVIRRTSL